MKYCRVCAKSDTAAGRCLLDYYIKSAACVFIGFSLCDQQQQQQAAQSRIMAAKVCVFFVRACLTMRMLNEFIQIYIAAEAKERDSTMIEFRDRNTHLYALIRLKHSNGRLLGGEKRLAWLAS